MKTPPIPSRMPIQLPINDSDYGKMSIPMGMMEPHHVQAMNNHGGQGLVWLAEHGGVSPSEALAILDDRPWHSMDQEQAKEELTRRIKLWTQEC